MEVSMDIAIENLANAVVLQAVEDYRSAKRHGKKKTIQKLKDFFHSEWFSLLTSVDPATIIDHVDSDDTAAAA